MVSNTESPNWTVCRVSDLGALSPKWDVSSNSYPPGSRSCAEQEKERVSEPEGLDDSLERPFSKFLDGNEILSFALREGLDFMGTGGNLHTVFLLSAKFACQGFPVLRSTRFKPAWHRGPYCVHSLA